MKRYIIYHNKRHPKEMGKQEIESFLTHLAVDLNVAASTQNQGHNHQGHEALDIQAVPHMGPAGGDIGRRKENRLHGLKKRI